MSDNDYLLPISFSMAAKIGLEETVLLTFLRQQAYLVNLSVLRIEISRLNAQLPFWTVPKFMRFLTNLQISQLLDFQRQGDVFEIQLTADQKPTIDSSSSGERAVSTGEQVSSTNDALMHKMGRLYRESLESPVEFTAQPQKPFFTKQPVSKQSVLRQSATKQYDSPSAPSVVNDRRGVTDFDLYLEQKERTRQPDQWLPEEATLEQIVQSGVARDFAVSLQPEFLLRIKEQRKNVRTWNSEFFKYVKRQWQYKQSDRSSYEGTSVSSKFNKTSREQVSDALSNIHDTDW